MPAGDEVLLKGTEALQERWQMLQRAQEMGPLPQPPVAVVLAAVAVHQVYLQLQALVQSRSHLRCNCSLQCVALQHLARWFAQPARKVGRSEDEVALVAGLEL